MQELAAAGVAVRMSETMDPEKSVTTSGDWCRPSFRTRRWRGSDARWMNCEALHITSKLAAFHLLVAFQAAVVVQGETSRKFFCSPGSAS